MDEHPAPIPIRDALICEREWMLVRVFDTNEHEPHKDVCLIETSRGERRVLRVGERRPPTFFLDGYVGRRIVIPKLYESSEYPLYECEEYLIGALITEVDPAPTSDGIMRPDLVIACIDGFWEIQTAFATQPLASRWTVEEQLQKHLTSARRFLSAGEQERIDRVLTVTADHWHPTHPAKWKYADDNIILLADGRLGLIDLARVGRYPWGYDLGWILWPRWYRMGIDGWLHLEQYLSVLEAFIEDVVSRAPTSSSPRAETIRQRCALVVLERTIGALYDVAESIPHIHRWLVDDAHKTVHVEFLRRLCSWSIDRYEASVA